MFFELFTLNPAIPRSGSGTIPGMASAPVPAATVIVARAAPSGFEVFLVRRPDRTSWGGAHVFPGGRLDDADLDPAWEGECDGAEAIAAAVPDDIGAARGFALAAIRETFEEAGVLIARTRDGAVVGPRNTPADLLAEARAAVHGQASPFHTVCRERGWRPALDFLLPWSRWITPAVEGRRYDARFFFAHAPAEQHARHDGSETVESTWLTPADAMRLHRAGTITLVPPTMRTLVELSAASSLDAVKLLDHHPSDAILPRIFPDDPNPTMAMPGDQRYDGPSTVRLSAPTRLTQLGGRWHFVDRLPAAAGDRPPGASPGS